MVPKARYTRAEPRLKDKAERSRLAKIGGEKGEEHQVFIR